MLNLAGDTRIDTNARTHKLMQTCCHADILSCKHIAKQTKVLFPSPNCIQHPAPAHGTNLLSPACVCVHACACACVEHVSEFVCVCCVLLCESVRVHDVPSPCVCMSHQLNLVPVQKHSLFMSAPFLVLFLSIWCERNTRHDILIIARY